MSARFHHGRIGGWRRRASYGGEAIGGTDPVTGDQVALADVHPLDAVRAGRWTRALFGTYALSLGFFEAAPLRALRRVGASDIRILADVSGVAASLGEAGAREVGRNYAVDAIATPGGCFHPKFVLLDGDGGPRLIVGSGNLTFGGWGSNLELFEMLGPATHPAAFADMANFLEALATSPRLDFPNAEVAASWSTTLRASVAPSGSDAVRIVHSVYRPIADQLVDMANAAGGARGLLVASPYFGAAGAVRALADALGVERVAVHVSTQLALAGRHYDFEADRSADPVVVEELDEEPRQRPMHAKLIEIECHDGVLSVSGSVNASGPALSRATNVELAVARLRQVPAATRVHIGALPPIPVSEADAEEGATTSEVLLATLVGRRLSGTVMARGAAGAWTARLDATGEFRDLGEIKVGADRRFSLEIKSGDDIGFGTRRAVLALSREDRRVAGFVTFPDLLELNRRWGPNAGSMIRVVGGSEEDEDIAGALDYFVRHPNDTAFPWGALASQGKGGGGGQEDLSVALSDLDIRPRIEAPPGAPSGVSWGSSAIDRLIAAVRRSMAAARTGAGRSDAGEGEDAPPGGAPPEKPERSELVLDRIREAFAGRVPLDPQTELHRLAELGLCVLARRPDAARVSEYAVWWCGLASGRLRVDPEREELARLTTAMVLIDALSARAPSRARRRIAAMVGPVEAALDAFSGGPPHLVAGIVEEATAGSAELEMFIGLVRLERSTVEELPILLAAIRAAEAPPPLQCLDREPEMPRLRRRIADGFAWKVPIAATGANSCPTHNIGMPASEVERLNSVGLGIAVNCCSSVVVLDRSL